jgi:hypothetical protein
VVVNKPFRDDYVVYMGNGFCVGTVHYHQQENKKTIHLKHCLGSGLRMLGMIFHQDSSSRGLKNAVT